MTKQEVIEGLKNGTVCLQRDFNNNDLMREILTTGFPDKPARESYSVDTFYWSAKGAKTWRASPFNNSEISNVVKLSEITE